MDDLVPPRRERLRHALAASTRSQRALQEALDRLDDALERLDEAHRRRVSAVAVGARQVGGSWRWN